MRPGLGQITQRAERTFFQVVQLKERTPGSGQVRTQLGVRLSLKPRLKQNICRVSGVPEEEPDTADTSWGRHESKERHTLPTRNLARKKTKE